MPSRARQERLTPQGNDCMDASSEASFETTTAHWGRPGETAYPAFSLRLRRCARRL